MSELGQSRRIATAPAVAGCPLRTESGQLTTGLGMSALCHKRTHASQQRRISIRSLRRPERAAPAGILRASAFFFLSEMANLRSGVKAMNHETLIIALYVLMVVAATSALIGYWACRPRTLPDVISLLIWGPVLSRRLRRRLVIGIACHIVWMTGMSAQILAMAFGSWRHGWQLDYGFIVICITLLVATALFVFIQRVATFLPTVYLARFRRHEDMLTIGFAALVGLFLWFFVIPIAVHFQVT
jgi:hypothetical protein